jgi:hypothetical protein
VSLLYHSSIAAHQLTGGYLLPTQVLDCAFRSSHSFFVRSRVSFSGLAPCVLHSLPLYRFQSTAVYSTQPPQGAVDLSRPKTESLIFCRSFSFSFTFSHASQPTTISWGGCVCSYQQGMLASDSCFRLYYTAYPIIDVSFTGAILISILYCQDHWH